MTYEKYCLNCHEIVEIHENSLADHENVCPDCGGFNCLDELTSCGYCNGTGIDAGQEYCKPCKGTGKIAESLMF